MVAFIPPPPPPRGPWSAFLTGLVEVLQRTLRPLVSKDEAVDRIILLAPNGTPYNVTVDDTGTLVVAANADKPGL
jgi:hypothetical protein